ncbi:MAG TPA: hypothetical protein VFU15_04390, partial [Bacteroidia bacterium]|nr:hypothetical protein [Bacteroidia bacterium]
MNQELVRKYRSGKLPAGIWLYSCLAGAVVAGVESVVLWDNSFNGAWAGMFLRVFIGNLLYTLPVFFAQAHFVAIALQKKKG